MTKKHLFALSLVFLLASYCYAATFGTVVPVRGTPSDIALDEQRGRLYVASLAAKRIDVVNTADMTFGASLSVPLPPSAVALSPNGQFLVAGLYGPYLDFPAPEGGVTIFDLDSGARRDLVIGHPVLAVSFGAGDRALVVTTSEFLLLDPATGLTEKLGVASLAGQPLSVPLGTFPPDIVRAATGVSGDGKSIVILAEVKWPPDEPPETAIIQYRVGASDVKVLNFTTSPPMGPRAVSVNQDGSLFVAGWVLMDRYGNNHAQFPYVAGDPLRKGGHAFDYLRNRIYADVPVPNGGEEKVLHVMATDNLAVRGMETDNPAGRERIQLPQMMAGRSVFTKDMQTLYAISDSGVMVLPVGALSKARRVAALQEDVLFQGDSCNRRVITQSVDIVDVGGGSTDFKLSLPTGTAGVRLLQTSGVTPARVQIEVDPTAFQNAKGTTAITLNIESSKAVNIPMPVRLLINTRDFDQRGTLVNVPGKIVDLMADRARNRFYMLRQDTNEVLVYDGVTMNRVDDTPSLRTGNTPMGMAFTGDGRYMLVGNDNSQYISVFDLETMQPSEPIWFHGHYPRMVAVGNGGIWATARPAGDKPHVFHVDFETRTATAPYSLGIYCNNFNDELCTKAFKFAESTLASTPSGNYIVLSTPDGETMLWDAGANEWVLSRSDLGNVTGAYGALSDSRFVVGDNLLDESLYPIAKLQTDTGATSGTAVGGGSALRTTAKAAAAPGTLERIDLEGLQSFHATSIIEAPVTAATLNTPRIGQIGQTILPFTRTLAVVENRPLLLSQSGLSVVAPDFDAPTTVPRVTAVASLADYVSGVAPGGLIAIQGNGLAPKFAVAESLPLPTALGEACATVNNVALPLFRVSPTEFAAQLPYSVVGNAQLVVRSPGGVSAPYPVQIQSAAPAIFRSGTAGDQTGLATVVRDRNGQLVNFTNPIHPEETITVFLTGMGRTSPEPALGDAAPLDPLAMVTNMPVVTIGGVSLPLIYAGLTPGNVGVYQINAWIPGAVRSASQTPLLIQQGGASTSVQVRVVNP